MNNLAPDREMLLQFAGLMFRNADPSGFVSLRAFRDNDRRDERAIFNEAIRLDDPDFAAIVLERARQAAVWDDPAVYCPPTTTFKTPRNAKTDNVHEGVDLSVECDQNPREARLKLEGMLGPATVVVASGGEWLNPTTGEIEPKVHLHWRLKNPTSTKAEHDLLREARHLATELVGGDGTNKSIVHPIRWPGSWHRKKTPRLAEIVASSVDSEIKLAEAVEILRDATGATTFAGFGFKTTNGKLEVCDHSAVASALLVIPNDSELKDAKGVPVHDWNYWNRTGMAIWAATNGSEVGREAFAKWSAKSSKNDPTATEARWQHYKTSPPTKIGFGTLVWLARQHSPGWTYNESAKDDLTAEYAVEPIEPVDLWDSFEPPELPKGLLPKEIEQYAFARGWTMGADPGGIAMAALAVCAAAIPDRIKLLMKPGDHWTEAARLWVGLVGLPSTKKSPIITATMGPLARLDAILVNKYLAELKQWEQLEKEEKKTHPKPAQKRHRMEDVTIEAAQEVLAGSPDGVLLVQDELSGFFGSMDKYSGHRGAAKDRGFWLQSFNGGSYALNRINRGVGLIPNLSVSLLGGIQPDVIRRLAGESYDDGFLQRMLLIVLRPATIGLNSAAGGSKEYSDLIERLTKLKMPASGSWNDDNDGVLRFDNRAQDVRSKLEFKHLRLAQAIETVNGKLAAHVGKFDGLFGRLCGLFHCIEHAPDSRIPEFVTGDTADRVARFIHQFLLPHAFAFYSGVLRLSDDHDRLVNVAGYILTRPEKKVLTNRDVQAGCRTMRDLERRDIEAVFEQLDALGWVTTTPGPRRTDPPHWLVNAAVHQKFTERAKAEAERRQNVRQIMADLRQPRDEGE